MSKTGFYKGRLGIGLTSTMGMGDGNPRYPLDINGDIRLTGAIVNGDGLALNMVNPDSMWNVGSNIISYSAGNVGIGTTSPNTALEVHGGALSGDEVMILVNSKDSAYTGLHGIFRQGGHHYDVYNSSTIQLNKSTSSGTDFYINHYSSGNVCMVTGGGNVGIGTTSPTAKLHVYGNQSVYLQGSTRPCIFYRKGATGDGTLKWVVGMNEDPAENYSITGYNSAGHILLTPTGNVGIGTTSPGAKLQINDDTGAANTICWDALTLWNTKMVLFGDNDTGGGIGIKFQMAANGDSSTGTAVGGFTPIGKRWTGIAGICEGGGTVPNQSGLAFYTYDGVGNASPAERMRIDGYGKVGINTTSPGYNLEVNGNLFCYDAFYSGTLHYYRGDTNTRRYWDANQMWWTCAGGTSSYEMWLKNGKVGIGMTTTDPLVTDATYQLHLNGSSGGGICMYRANSTVGTLRMAVNSSQVFFGSFGSSTHSCDFYTNGTRRMRIKGNGEISFGTSFDGQNGYGINFKDGFLVSNTSGYHLIHAQAGAAQYGIIDLKDMNSLTTRIKSRGDSYFNGGNLGIGTTTPGYKLEIKQGKVFLNNSNTWSDTDAANTKIYLGDKNFGVGSGHFTGDGAGEYTTLWSYNGAGRGIRFCSIGTGTNKFSDYTTHMIIEGDTGNVGIGTTSPTTILTIKKPIDSSAYGSGTSMIDFKSYFPGYDETSVKASIYCGVSDEGSLHTRSGYMAFMTHNPNGDLLAERMRIERTGNVGIGTTSPSDKLHVKNGALYLEEGKIQFAIANRTYQSNVNFGISIRHGSYELPIIHTEDPTSRGHICFQPSNGYDDSSIIFKGYGSSTTWDGTGAFGTERMRIQHDGKVGIGEASPEARLHIYAGIEAMRIVVPYNNKYFQTNWYYGGHHLDVYYHGSTKGFGSTGNGGSMYFNYYSAGGVYLAGSTAVTSDDRLKHNEQNIDNALNIINQLKPQKYFKSQKAYDEDYHYQLDASGNPITEDEYIIETGFIAQDVEKIPILNYLVTKIPDKNKTIKQEKKDSDGNYILDAYGNKITEEVEVLALKNRLALKYTDIFVMNVAATQELYKENQELKTEVATLKSELALIKQHLGI